MRCLLRVLFLLWIVLFMDGCASPKPLSYLASRRPDGIIISVDHQEIHKSYSRGGFYFFNYNFRPPADIRRYIKEAEAQARVNMLKNTDIELKVPFAFDIFLFGYHHGTDTIGTVRPCEEDCSAETQ